MQMRLRSSLVPVDRRPHALQHDRQEEAQCPWSGWPGARAHEQRRVKMVPGHPVSGFGLAEVFKVASEGLLLPQGPRRSAVRGREALQDLNSQNP